MKTTIYKSYRCNGFTIKYYSKPCIRDGVYYGECVIAYYNGRRIVDRSTSEKRGLYDIICRLSDEERRRTTDAYINENAARMGVAPCIVKAHIEEVQKKNGRAAVPAHKMEITAADIALYDYALGGAPVDGYTIGCADAVLKLMKKEGITPAAVDRARKKMKKQQPAPAAPVVDAPAADDAPAVDEQPAAFTPHIESNGDLHYENYTVKDDNGNAVVFGSYIPAFLLMDAPAADEQPAAPVVDVPAADDAPAPSSEKTETTPSSQKNAEQLETERIEKVIADYECGIYPRWYVKNLHCESDYFFNCDVISWGRKQIKVKNLETGKNKIFSYDWFIRVVEYGSYIVSMPYDVEYMAMLKRKQQPTEKQPATAATVVDAPAPAVTDTDIYAAAARIKSNYEAMMQQAAADAYADAITAYCAAMEEPAAPAWMPEVIILKEQPAAAAADEQPAPAPRARRPLNIAPRLSRWLHPARWVAVAFVVCLLSGLLLGMNTSTAVDADADDIAAVYELAPVIITAAVTDAPAAPSPVKKLAAPSPVKKAAADAVTPAGQKTASDMAAADAPAADNADSLTTAPAAPGLQPTPPDGLTICAGTAWAYTMMNWA